MIQTTVDLSQFPAFARAMNASPKEIAKSLGKALFRIGRSDIDKMKSEQLSGGKLHVRSKGFLNSFKFKAADSRKIQRLNQLFLTEYTGAKPLGIFQTGGMIAPRQSKTLTILTASARTASGKRKYTQAQLQQLIASHQARIIKTGRGAAIILEKQSFTKSGSLRAGSRTEILAFLRPRTVQQKRIGFFENFEANDVAHNAILEAAADEALQKTANSKG